MSSISLSFLTEMFQIIKKHCDVNLSLIGEILQDLPSDQILRMPKLSPRKSIESSPVQKDSAKKSPKKKKSGR